MFAKQLQAHAAVNEPHVRQAVELHLALTPITSTAASTATAANIAAGTCTTRIDALAREVRRAERVDHSGNFFVVGAARRVGREVGSFGFDRARHIAKAKDSHRDLGTSAPGCGRMTHRGKVCFVCSKCRRK
jgi:hypothetical protein